MDGVNYQCFNAITNWYFVRIRSTGCSHSNAFQPPAGLAPNKKRPCRWQGRFLFILFLLSGSFHTHHLSHFRFYLNDTNEMHKPHYRISWIQLEPLLCEVWTILKFMVVILEQLT